MNGPERSVISANLLNITDCELQGRQEPPYRADPGSWPAVDAAPERDDLRAATRVPDVGSYR
jgi:hypothetical protein